MQSKNIIRPAIATFVILLIPLVAVQLSSEINWNLVDFIIMGTLLFCAGLALELIVLRFTVPAHRVLVSLAILLILLLIWAELAVGIFGTPFAGS
jgi:ABC-type enterobactin transport system permease subunit